MSSHLGEVGQEAKRVTDIAFDSFGAFHVFRQVQPEPIECFLGRATEGLFLARQARYLPKCATFFGGYCPGLFGAPVWQSFACCVTNSFLMRF